MTSGYHGSKIPGSQPSFLTETAICIVELWNKSIGYRFVPECSLAQESHTCHFFSAIFAGPRFVEVPTFFYHGNVTASLLYPALKLVFLLFCSDSVTLPRLVPFTAFPALLGPLVCLGILLVTWLIH